MAERCLANWGRFRQLSEKEFYKDGEHVLTFAAIAQADLRDDAVAAHERGKYQLALRLLQPLVETGDADDM